MPEPIGDLAAGLLLNFVLEEFGLVIYNRAISDAQTRLQIRLSDLSGELYARRISVLAETRRQAQESPLGSVPFHMRVAHSSLLLA